MQSENFRSETPDERGDGVRIPSNGEIEIYNAKKFVLLDPGPVTIGTKRCYFERDELLFQENVGGNMWKTIVALGFVAGVGFMSCRGVVNSDVLVSPSGLIGIQAIAFGNGRFVAGDWSGRMATSADGISWTVVGNSTFGASDINAIAFGNGRFVAVGRSGRMATSTDGTSWTAVANSTFGTNNILAIAFGNGRFVAGGDTGGFVGNSRMAQSTDGINWTALSLSGTVRTQAIAFGNGMWMAGGDTGIIPGGGNGWMAQSTDGINWTAVNIPAANQPFAIAFGNGIWIAGGDTRIGSGWMAQSTDGINWVAINDPSLANLFVSAIAFANGTWAAVGGGGNRVVQSTDGINWTAVNIPTITGANAVAFGNDAWVVGGADGRISRWIEEDPFMHTRFGFLEKRITANAHRYKLSDGRWMNFNNNGSVTWSEN